MKKLLSFFFLLAVVSGCVQMRDYTAVKRGAFAVCAQTGFGEGGMSKDYYMVDDSLAIIVGDTKTEVIKKIGSPDKIERTLDGYDAWSYEDRNLELFFRGDRLAFWHAP